MDTLAFEHILQSANEYKPEKQGDKALDMISQLMAQGMNLAMIYHLMKKEGSSLTKKATELAMDKIKSAGEQASKVASKVASEVEEGQARVQDVVDGGRQQMESAQEQLSRLNNPVERITIAGGEDFDEYPFGFKMTSDPTERFPTRVEQPEAEPEFSDIWAI